VKRQGRHHQHRHQRVNVRAVRKLDDDKGVPQVDDGPRGVAAGSAKQDHDQQAGRQIKQHRHDLKGHRRFRRETIDGGEENLRGGQVGRGHLRVVDQGAVGCGEVVERGRVHAVSVRAEAVALHLAIPEIAIHVVGERGRCGEEREAEEEGEDENDALRPDRFPKTCQV